MGDTRRHGTTTWIRGAAFSEFLDLGPRAFTLAGVAERAFHSKGAVYQRWPHKEACIADLVHNDLPARAGELCRRWSDPELSVPGLIEEDLTEPENLITLRFLAECVLAARDEQTLGPTVVRQLEEFAATFGHRAPDAHLVPALGWWGASTWVGYGILKTSGCPLPDSLVGEITAIVMQLGHAARLVADLGTGTKDLPTVTNPGRHVPAGDFTEQKIIEATQGLVAAEGVDGASLRSIAEQAGVTTGALYRRFRGRSEVLATAFRAGLDPDRYAWSDELVACVAAADGAGVARVLTDTCARIWQDRETANRLLEYTVAAHTDATVRAAVFSEMVRVSRSRFEIFQALIDADIVRPEISAEASAWLLQVPMVGMRLLASIGITPGDKDLYELLGAYLTYLVARE